jgi:hypothetical protein
MSDNFDRWLEDELGRSLDRVDRGYVAPRYLDSSAPRRGRAFGFLAGLPLPALLTTKAAAASLVVLAATGTGVAVKTAATGTPNPLVWGQQVMDQVQKCKDQLGAGQHGIGQCVSQFAKQHGDQTSDQHGKGKGNDGDGTGDDGSTASPSPNGKSDSHPTPPAHSTPAAADTAHPAASHTPQPASHGVLVSPAANPGGKP